MTIGVGIGIGAVTVGVCVGIVPAAVAVGWVSGFVPLVFDLAYCKENINRNGPMAHTAKIIADLVGCVGFGMMVAGACTGNIPLLAVGIATWLTALVPGRWGLEIFFDTVTT